MGDATATKLQLDDVSSALVRVIESCLGREDGAAHLVAQVSAMDEATKRSTNAWKGYMEIACEFVVNEHLEDVVVRKRPLKDTPLRQLVDLMMDVALQVEHLPAIQFFTLYAIASGLPISECSEVWTWVEAHKLKLVGVKGLWLLRFCNELLRRFSNVREPDLSGRVLLFLSEVTELRERSALNIPGRRHTEGMATPVSEEEFAASIKAADAAAGGKSAGPQPVDYSFYEAFWSIQPLLVQPDVIISNESEREAICERINVVLSAFEAQPLTEHDLIAAAVVSDGASAEPQNSSADLMDLDVATSSSSSHGRKRKRSAQQDPSGGAGETVGVQYLTGPRLLRFQLRDPFVRVQLLGQILILQHSVDTCKPDVKKPAGVWQQGRSAALTHLKLLVARARRLLEGTPPRGAALLRLFDAVIQRDSNYTLWKAKACKTPIERYGLKSGEALPANRFVVTDGGELPPQKKRGRWMEPLQDAVFEKEEKEYGFDFKNLGAMSVEIRMRVPSLQSEVGCYLDAEDPANEIEASEHPKKDRMYCWSLLRCMATEQLSLLEGIYGDVDLAVAAYRAAQEKEGSAGPREGIKDE